MSRLNNFFIPIIIIITILNLILPIPHIMLDFLLAINIILAAIIMLNTIYLKTALDLSIFPTLIVVTTIYRLSLNVTATKLILSEGEAGEVIRGFGSFVGRNNLVVGFVIFFIIMIVNFLVITKGSERVAEVAARFTLDAMPGKQMAIDADLNTGLISEAEAKERRRKIQREADFYGSMDGASKFVKNDAIAGIIITFLNIAGGLIIGVVMRGEEITEALNNYTILTIGDGLVSQLPALMLSVATSFIVTRAGAESDLNKDFIRQLFYNPKVLYVSAALSAAMAPFLTPVPFLILAGVLVFVAYKVKQLQKEAVIDEEVQIQESEVEEIRKPENVVTLLQVDPIELEFGYGIIPLADANQGGDLLDRVVLIRRQLALELGMIVPVIRLRDNIQIGPNEYIIKIKGSEIAKGELLFDYFMAMNSGGVEEELDGIKTVEPAFGLPAIWIQEGQRDKAEMLGYTVVDPPSIIATHLTEVIKKHSYELLGRQEVQTLVDNIRQTNPAIVDELVPKLMGIGEIQKVLANLLKENVSIRDMVTIMETLADYSPMTHDVDMLTEYVRQALGRSISQKFFNGNSNVITIDPKVEQMIMDAIQKTEFGSYLALDPAVSNTIINNVSRNVQRLMQLGNQPIVLASPIVRLYFKRLTENVIPGLIVLSYNEIDPAVEIQSIGTVSV
ncbi:flagellar biosynthesis protein FlhA [Ruminiclostridium hungatei]|uniref:Flagellar biosynthesis protein FlhA n=1 Tax=Ruminiclostridium hungatei TaxID=48256 RepID=A0A1V4SLA2_RUMHU|nr:flagellar biosynthesis protein FlhA [Ruminiclostridium hungatei]OPX44573.1 flagellar biosynthesis protein FlhA [Ruminiclostridium hungatei]